MSRITDLKVKIFADGADYDGIVKMAKNPADQGLHDQSDFDAQGRGQRLRGLRAQGSGRDPGPAGVVRGLCRRLREHGRAGARDRGMGPNVNVKIPVTNTKGQSASELLRVLSSEGVVLNVTAIFTLEQVRAVADALDPATPAIVSVFAGRIADTGVDPIPHMLACKQILGSRPKAELLWASTAGAA